MEPIFTTLSFGPKIALAPCEAESIAFGIFVASGSRHEPPKDAGISHFIEHMLFKGTAKRRAIDITRAIEGRGGNFNAYTGEESTCFFAHMPSEYLREAIDILGDMYLNASFPEDEFEREKNVVAEEIKMYKDDPDSVADENLQMALFPLNALGSPVAGSEETVSRMTRERLHEYMQTHYLASNTVLALAGDFDPEEAKTLLEKTFSPLKARSNRRKVKAKKVDFTLPPTKEVRVARDLNQVKLSLGYRSFGWHDKRKFAAAVLDSLLGRGMSSRLFQEVREKRGLAYSIASQWQFFEDAGMFTVSAGLSATNAKTTIATIERELERVKTKPVSKAELERTKEFIVGNFRLAHEKVLSKMLFYGSMLLSFPKPLTTHEQVAAIRAVTPEEIRDVARDVFKPENRATSWVVPR